MSVIITYRICSLSRPRVDGDECESKKLAKRAHNLIIDPRIHNRFIMQELVYLPGRISPIIKTIDIEPHTGAWDIEPTYPKTKE